METSNDKYIYSKPVIEFVTVATELCKFLEQREMLEREQWIDIARGLLAMVYLKASFLGSPEEVAGFNERSVTEGDYEMVRGYVSAEMGEMDDYLDVFVSDFKYSDTPVLRTISEDMADIYQYLRDLVEIFRNGHEEAMQLAMFEAVQSFGTEWGQTILNALRALHDARFGGSVKE